MSTTIWTRRRVIAGLAGGFVTATATVHARAAAALGPVRASGFDWLELFNTHTSETLKVSFRSAGQFVTSALARLELVLADHRSGEHREMDPRLYTMLADLAAAADREPRFEIISGYRSPATNAKLRSRGGGQAKNSQHTHGRAVDIRMEGVSCRRLRDLAVALECGGVGYYARSNFVHVDTARVRYWEG